MRPGAKAPAVPGLLRRLNVRRVLDTIARQGPCTRADLCRRTRISAPTMSKLVAELARRGILEADRTPAVTRGRPGVVFRLARRRGAVIGAVIDIDRITLVSASLDGAILPGRGVSIPTPRSFDLLVRKIAETVGRLRAAAAAPCRGIGLTLPGLIDRRSGRVRFSPNLHFLDGRSPGEALAIRTGLHVAAIQEEHALCLAAQRFGAARGLSDFALIDVSAGFGMGVVSAGRFIEGSRGYAGEIGHVRVAADGPPCGCGNRGCLETVATDPALAAAASARAGRLLTIGEVIEESRAGRLRLDGVLETALEHLALAVSMVVNIFNPEAILLHGRMFDLEDNLLDRLAERVRRMALGPSLECCRLLRAEADKTLGAVAGILEAIFAGAGPSLDAGNEESVV